jgi:hypothetical protein
MTEATELKPCPKPWCLSHGKLLPGVDGTPILYYGLYQSICVGCPICSLKGPIRHSEAEAIAGWNDRQSSVPVQGEPVAGLEFNDIEVAIAEGLILHCDMDEDRDSARIEQVSTAIAKRVREAVPHAPTERERVLLPATVDRGIMASVKLGAWMSAALDDPAVCDAMKADIREWFSAGEPFHAIYAAIAQAQEPSNER